MRYVCRCRQIWDLLERDFPFYCVCGFVAKAKEDMLQAAHQTAPPPVPGPVAQACLPCAQAALVVPTAGTLKPGTELKTILGSIGIHPMPECPCIEHMLQMDAWGPAGCRANRETIVHWLRMGYKSWGWGAILMAGVRAARTDLPYKVRWRDPFPGLVDEAIRRSLIAH